MLRKLLFLLAVFAIWTISPVSAQDNSSGQLVNGNMEAFGDQDSATGPTGWRFVSPSGAAKIGLESNDPFEGGHSAWIDARKPGNLQSGGMSANLIQSVDGKLWRGKRIRFRAAVKTDNLEASAAAQLWFRVDRESNDGSPQVGAFDNMRDRPIRGSEWQHYDIVLQVNDDASRLVFGMFLIGLGEAWMDDVSLVEVGPNTPTTDVNLGITIGNKQEDDSTSDRANSSRPKSPFQMPPLVMKALADAENAPQQPFFTHWMWLALIAVSLFCLSAFPAKEIELESGDQTPVKKTVLGFVPKFAVRFSVAYWLLYSLPTPLNSLTGQLGSSMAGWFQRIYGWYENLVTSIVTWVAKTVFQFKEELVPPNGSGDTTFNYIEVFTFFVLALLIAGIWTAADWRKTDYRHVKDLLHSYLRYVLAVTLLSYGLAKLGWDSNQFPPLDDFRLERTWGESSPMGVLWSFMGASRPYTFFAGLSEVIGGCLLLFRRTTLLGSLVVLGVMTNVMMLNYCYDIPVKLYSTHLLGMAAFLMLPDIGRLLNMFLLHRPTSPNTLGAPYTNSKTIWLKGLVKLVLIVLLVGLPVYQHVNRQIEYFAAQARLPEFFGVFDVVEFKLNDEPVEGSDAENSNWKSVKFEQLGYNRQMERVPSSWMTIGLNSGNAAATFTANDYVLTMEHHQMNSLPTGQVELSRLEEDSFELSGLTTAGRIEVTLKRQDQSEHRLINRGYRWINEVPFNR